MDDRPAHARAHRNLADAYRQLSRVDDAHTYRRLAFDLYGELGDSTGQARTHLIIANVCAQRARYADALGHAQQALDLYRAVDHRPGQTSAFNSIGWFHALGPAPTSPYLLRAASDDAAARQSWEQALTIFEELGDPDAEQVRATLSKSGEDV